MNGDIKLSAPGGLPGDIWLDTRSGDVSNFTITGRVLGVDGLPRAGAVVTVLERRSLTVDVAVGRATTDSRGGYKLPFALPAASDPGDVFAQAEDPIAEEVQISPLLSDLVPDRTRMLDFVLGEGEYQGRSEWDRLVAKIDPFMGTMLAKDIPLDRIEWLTRRSDVSPLQLAAYIQAHRLAHGRSVKPQTCYAFIRAGLPADLEGLLRAGEVSWRSALQAAWSRFTLPSPGDGSTEDRDEEATIEVAAMRELLVDAMVLSPVTGINQRTILDTAGFSESQQRDFAELWVEHTGSLEDFWTTVAGSPLSAEAPVLEFTLRAATIANNHIPTIQALQAERLAESIATIADTAAWSPTRWDEMLEDQSVTPPDSVPGADATERRQNYARSLYNAIEDGHPSRSLRHALERDEAALTPPPHSEFVATFLTSNPLFNVAEGTIAVYLASPSSSWAGIDPEDQAQAKANLETVQRIFRMTPKIGRYASTKVLLDQGFTSASSVVRKTKEEFVEALGGVFSDADHHAEGLAEAVWETAAEITATTIALGSQFGLTKGNANWAPLSYLNNDPFEESENGLAALSEIFGSLDYCGCQHCRSVFSPAAYLADLLKFLHDRDILDELTERRPDIPHILLDCTNTNTVLPYIDLVNELLEAYIAADGVWPPLEPTSKQTSWTAQELRLHPEHLNSEVYNPESSVDPNLLDRVHPWNLPFSLPTVEAQTYLARLGVPRHQLMRDFLPVSDEDVMAGDVLGLSEIEFQIIAGLVDGDCEFWGFPTDTEGWVDILRGTPGDVGQLLSRGRFTLDQLVEYLTYDYINPDGDLVLQWSDSCTLVGASIAFMEEDHLDRLHRFTRLQRVCKIPPRMLNILIQDALGGVLNAASLRDLANIVLLKHRLRLAWDVIATFWATRLDPRTYSSGDQSLYSRRFLAKDLGDHEPFVLAGDLSGLLISGGPIEAEHLPRILAGVGVKQSDYDLLIASLEEPTLTLETLTALFRSAALARGLSLSISDLVLLLGVNGLVVEDAFADPATTIAFADAVQDIRTSGFSIIELRWLLRRDIIGADPLEPEGVARILVELTRGLATIEAEATQLAARPEAVDALKPLEANLVNVFDEPEDLEEDLVAKTMAIVDLSTSMSVGEQNTFIDTYLVRFVDPTEAKDSLVAGAVPALVEDVNARAGWLLGKAIGHLRRRAYVFDSIAAKLGVPADVAEALTKLLSGPPGAPSLFEVFRMPFASEEEILAGLTPVTDPPQFTGWGKLAKAATVCRNLTLRADEVRWYSGRETWLDLDALPLFAVDPHATFAAWQSLVHAIRLRGIFRTGEIAFAQVPEGATLADAVDIFAEHAGWDAAAMTALATSLTFTAEDMRTEVAPTQLRRIVEVADRLGVSISEAQSWTTGTPTTSHATAIKLAARAKYGEQRWAEVAVPLRDTIRERQRDALVDMAIAITDEFTNANDVFESLLIDVEMSHCMMTSRIKQAITSVQIFLHRVFLHLETPKLGAEAIARWEWMKNYRVWEANRKVFLYPENWIEPELRLNKTPEFESLEAHLMQGPLDATRVEMAVEMYLEKLDRVSGLEMIGVYEWGVEVWLLGRTHGDPHEWFVRHRASTGAWGCWEEVPTQLDSDAVAVTVIDNRLQLFWVTTQECNHSVKTQLDNAVPGVVFQISHLERSPRGEWSKPQLSPRSSVEFATGSRLRLHLVEVPEGVGLTIMSEWDTGSQFAVGEKVLDTSYGYGNPLLKFEEVAEGINGLHLRANFSYTKAQRQLHFEGTRFVGSKVNNAFVFVSQNDLDLNSEYAWEILVKKTWFEISYIEHPEIGMMPNYGLSGQRFINQHYAERFEDATWLESDASKLIQVWRGTKPGLLFERASLHSRPGFIHQATMWALHETQALGFPIVYDDRMRKYLLEPDMVQKQHEAGTSQSPDLGGFDLAPYIDCGPADPLPAFTIASRGSLDPERSDRLQRPSRYVGGPGQHLTVGGVKIGGVLGNQVEDLVAASTGGGGVALQPGSYGGWAVQTLYHPYAKMMTKAFAGQGVRGLYSPSESSELFRQVAELDVGDSAVLGAAIENFPIEEFDFRFSSTYGTYNWELFYHVPMLVAQKLAAEQRWDEAQAWHHMMFNPISLVDEDGPSKYWRIKPFVAEAGGLAKDQFEIMAGIGVSKAQQEQEVATFAAQVKYWEQHPFDPHAVARIRPGVYQRALLRKYFDNLIAWADNLYRRDTMESIAEATVLYIMISQLLGPKPQEVAAPPSDPKSFDELLNSDPGLDAFANALIALESFIHLPSKPVGKKGCEPSTKDAWVRVPIVSHFWYFCYPPNPQLLAYWDIIADRLFKIRHCQNIEGVERALALFEPPIDPALLVQATAAGVDLQSVLGELDTALPPYRFRSVHARAVAFTNSLKGLASALLSALEKRDGEDLALLRSEHEQDMLARVRDVRMQQLAEARSNVASLEAAKRMVEDRSAHYTDLITEGHSEKEDRNFELSSKAAIMRRTAAGLQLVGGVLGSIPQLSITSQPSMGWEYGGIHLSNTFGAVASVFNLAAAEHEYHATKSSLTASYERRAQDWALQLSQAEKEIARIDRDIVGATIRVRIAEREIDNHDLQVQQSRDVDMFMRSKFSNHDLYNWMVGQLSTLYFQTYQLAFDLAKRAERAYRYELAVDAGAPIIKYGYWDSLRKGLLSGDKLGHDLERLELAYMDRDRREFELRKSVSLAELSPLAVEGLRENGWCDFDLPETLFDIDHPGHYMRRIRAIRITIPAVVGPHTTLGAQLSLTSHKTRISTVAADSEAYAEEPLNSDEAERFRYGTGGGQAIATSTAVQDSGMFNLDFRDERYLPFEYAGAVSKWNLSLPDVVRQFDYRTIEDVVVHIDYTARNGGSGLRTACEGSLKTQINEGLEGQVLSLLVSVHEAFPNEWEQFFSLDGSNHVLSMPMTADHFPYFARRTGIVVAGIRLAMLLDSEVDTESLEIDATLDIGVALGTFETFEASGPSLLVASFVPTTTDPSASELTIAGSEMSPLYSSGALDPEKLLGMVMIVTYTLETP